jgi:tRNA (Thr-GGU) A37 N-methylase
MHRIAQLLRTRAVSTQAIAGYAGVHAARAPSDPNPLLLSYVRTCVLHATLQIGLHGGGCEA